MKKGFKPPPHPWPAEADVLARRLAVVTLLVHGLPVAAVPEQRHVALVRLDLVHDGRRAHAHGACLGLEGTHIAGVRAGSPWMLAASGSHSHVRLILHAVALRPDAWPCGASHSGLYR
jgi:hypothetical protein